MRMRRIILDFLSVNCYLLINETTKEALLVDPGSSPDRIKAVVASEGVKVVGVLLTHAHVDHISEVRSICDEYGVGVWIHPADLPIYFSKINELPPYMRAPENLPQPLEECPTAGLEFQILHTPGHTPGGVCYYFPKEGIVLTGDTLFQGTYGRTDFPGGNETDIFTSIREKLLTLPEDTRVYPGHEDSTTIAKEKKNPLFR